MPMTRMLRLFHRVTLGDQSYRFLFQKGPPGEAVALDCETTGLDPRRDEVVAIAAVEIIGNRILTSRRFEVIVRPDIMPAAGSIKIHGLRERDVAGGRPMHEIIPALLHFIGGRPLVGYYIDFDVRMLDKSILPMIQAKLPNPRIEVSRLYYDRKYGNAPPGTVIDLRFMSILADLGIPPLEQHVAVNDAVMTAMMYLQLQDLKARGTYLPRRQGGQAASPPTGA